MKRIFKIFNILVLIWGYLCLAIVAFAILQMSWRYINWSNGEGDASISTSQAQKVVHRLIGWRETKVEKVIYGYESPRSFTGDGINVYYLKLDIIPSLDGRPYDWHRGDKLDAIGKKCVSFMDGWGDAKHLEDFQNEKGDLQNSQNYFYFRTTKFNNGDHVSDATLIMVNPAKNLYYCFEGNT